NTPMFQSDVESMTPSQKELLRAVCHGERQLSSASVRERYRLGNPNTFNKNKKMLIDKDIIELGDDGSLTIVDPMFKIWLG
ncbi:MAG: ATP-binding protein, partial [Prevotella sp.]|nr:ATP-binding protein [Candidatus Prevotella equi]